MASYAVAMRNALLERLKLKPFFAAYNAGSNPLGFKKYSKTRAFQIQPESIPLLAVYLMNELLLPEGDANHSEPRFHMSARYGFSVVVQNNDPEIGEEKLDQAYLAIQSLFNDPTLFDSAANPRIQGLTRGERVHNYGGVGLNNEIPTAELRFQLTCDLGWDYWPPQVDDWLQAVHLETAFPDVAHRDEVVQIIRSWEFYNLSTDGLTVGSPVFDTPTLTTGA